MTELTEVEQAALHSILDFPVFCKEYLKVRTKDGRIVPFCLNRGQLHLFNQIQKMYEEKGYVRIIVSKGRQMGITTMVQAMYFWRILISEGLEAFVLTHASDATNKVFEMTKRFYKLLPPGLCMPANILTRKELRFSDRHSGYNIGTAGSDGVGRSQTIHLLHCSEVAYWPNSHQQAAGILQCVPLLQNTYIILESTANGTGNYFYDAWMSAESGESIYRPIFVSWYWDNTYKMNVPLDFRITEEEQQLMEMYQDNGLTLEHLVWRRMKMAELSRNRDSAIELFRREYPFSASESFSASNANQFIQLSYVEKAMASSYRSDAPLRIGVDPAISNHDRCTFIRRRGACVFDVEYLYSIDEMEIVGRIVKMIREENPARVYIDSIGIGSGIVSRLLEMGYGNVIRGVDVRKSPTDKDRYVNLRAEIWDKAKSELYNTDCYSLPNDAQMLEDLTVINASYTSRGQLKLESKEDLRSRGKRSPDAGDAWALTYAEDDNLDTATYMPSTLPHRARGMLI